VENVLVCLLCSTRAQDLTFPSFKRQVLDELNADLALAITIDEKYDYANPFWQHAKYRWTAPDYEDYGEGFDIAQQWLCQQKNIPAPNWRSMLRLQGIWAGKIRSPDPRPSASSVQPFCRWLLLRGLQRDGILDRYDRFVISRSDFMWLCPHPPLSILDCSAIWVPDGEHWGGLNDRHLVASRADIENCLNGLEDILLDPDRLYDEMVIRRPSWNNERFFAHHLGRKGLLEKTKMFPYVMYTARGVRDQSPTYSAGRYEPSMGNYVKAQNEFRSARAFATIIHSHADWENGSWREFDPASAVFSPIPLARQLWYGWQRIHVWVSSQLSRPGLLRRVYKKIVRYTNAPRS
jgi:hypothetical protein